MFQIIIHTTATRRTAVSCPKIADCVTEWVKHRDPSGDHPGIRSSQQRGDCGDVIRDGKKVARVAYNGTVWPVGEWSPSAKPLTPEEIAQLESE